MPSIVVTGAARGLGFGLCKYYSSQGWKVFALVRRNKEETETNFKKAGAENVTVLLADVKDSAAVEKAAEEVSKATGGSLDIVINNAAYISQVRPGAAIHQLSAAEVEAEFTEEYKVDVIAVAIVTNAFLPLIRAGATKKVITLGTGLADIDMALEFDFWQAPTYATAKAATNMLVAKYHAALGKEGIVFLSLSPGFVDNHPPDMSNPDFVVAFNDMVGKFGQYATKYKVDFQRPLTIEESVQQMVENVIGPATVETVGRKFLSHHGDKQWL